MDDACLKLMIYFGEEDKNEHGRVADSLMELFERRQVELSMLTVGTDGFGRRRLLHTDRFPDASYDLPLMLMAVDTRAVIEPLLPDVRELVSSGIVTLTEGRLIRKDTRLAVAGQSHNGTRLTVLLARDEEIDGAPAYRRVVAQLHAHGVSGSTVILGADGTFHGRRERTGLLQKLPRSPLMIISVGQHEEIETVLPALVEMLPNPLMILEPVRLGKQDGVLLDAPEIVYSDDGGAWEVFQQFVVFSGLHSRYRRRPLYPELVYALLRASASGATVLRGVWGYAHGSLPHGERIWSLQRRIPTVTVVIEDASHVAQTLAGIDSLTESAGFVTSEIVRGYHGRGQRRPSEPLLRRLHLRSRG